MRSTPELDAATGLEKLATYPYQVLTWVDDDGLSGQRRGRRPDRPDGPDRRGSTRRPGWTSRRTARSR